MKSNPIRDRVRSLSDADLRSLILELSLSTRLEQSTLAMARRERARRKRADNRNKQALPKTSSAPA